WRRRRRRRGGCRGTRVRRGRGRTSEGTSGGSARPWRSPREVTGDTRAASDCTAPTCRGNEKPSVAGVARLAGVRATGVAEHAGELGQQRLPLAVPVLEPFH